MDFPRSSRDACVLSADEASVLETAVRAAVMSVLKVFCEVSERRSQRYEAKLAAAERENAALRGRLESAEQELRTYQRIPPDYRISAEVTLSTEFSPEARRETGQEPPSDLVIKQEEEEEGGGGEEGASQDTLCFKAEDHCDHPDINTAQTDRRSPGAQMWNRQHLQTFSAPRHTVHPSREKWIPGDGPNTGRRKSRECVRRYRERIRADPEKYHAWKEKERLRSFRRRKRIQDLPEPMQKLQREAWREATRRHRARKMAQTAGASTDINPTL